ncbi:YfdX family protein [Methylobacterium oryzihabitans]|uniref:YfdX family protein n=1 Tax=Methylobacterium oryzihabitans TaxID=2499852 RepID=A0A3S2V483_9HYPH|nr:YfdX family protein [Methylobacterium oryzihabitans]RVU15182.1 YfdX family protein [Methylobacterium oryzihabitans]
MSYRKSLAAALVATTVVGGAAYAAEQTAKPVAMQETTARTAIDRDVGKLSKDGAQAFRDMQLTRVAIFNADPAQAKSLIGQAQAALAKARTDDAVFTRDEAGLRTPADLAATKAAGASADKASADKARPAGKEAASKGPVAWMPVDAQLTLGEDFLATPAKASAVTEANKSLAKGDQTGAIETLKLAHIDVNFVMAVLPLDKTAADVNQAASLIDQGKYYEANATLKSAEDGMRFDVVDAVGLPRKAAAPAAAKPTAAKPAAQPATPDAQPAK